MGATVKELRVVRTPLRVELHVVLKHPDRQAPKKPVVNPVGIDTGIVRKQRALSNAVEAHKQREKAAGKKLPASNTRKKKQETFARAWRRDTEEARQSDFRLAHYLVTTFDGIAIEHSNLMGWSRSRRWGKKLRDQSLSHFPPILEHEAEKAGIPYKEVNPAHTTTRCSQCGHRQPMPLEVRVYECGNCNAAINISVRAFGRTTGSGGIPRCRRAIQDVDIRPCSLQGESGNHTPQNEYLGVLIVSGRSLKPSRSPHIRGCRQPPYEGPAPKLCACFF